jgi:hypothetical protein
LLSLNNQHSLEVLSFLRLVDPTLSFSLKKKSHALFQ